MNGCQISVVDLDELVQVFSFLDLVLKLQSCAVQDLPQRQSAHDSDVCNFPIVLKRTTTCSLEHLQSERS